MRPTKYSVRPFFLSTLSGNPRLVYNIWGDELQDSESSNIMMARAEDDPTEDMLFLGGDLNNGGFLAWKRIE